MESRKINEGVKVEHLGPQSSLIIIVSLISKCQRLAVLQASVNTNKFSVKADTSITIACKGLLFRHLSHKNHMRDTSQVSYVKEDLIILLSQPKTYPEKERHV